MDIKVRIQEKTQERKLGKKGEGERARKNSKVGIDKEGCGGEEVGRNELLRQREEREMGKYWERREGERKGEGSLEEREKRKTLIQLIGNVNINLKTICFTSLIM